MLTANSATAVGVNMYFSPIFGSLMDKINSMTPEEYNSKAGCRLFALAMKHAPAEFNDMFIKGAMEQGLFPKPTHCDDNGNPLYSFEELTTFFGQTPEEGQKALNEMLEFMPDMKDELYQGAVHRYN